MAEPIPVETTTQIDIESQVKLLEAKFAKSLSQLVTDFKQKVEAETTSDLQTISVIKAERQQNVSKLDELKAEIQKVEEKVKFFEDNDQKISKSPQKSKNNTNIDLIEKQKLQEMIKKEEKNEYLSWELMTRLYAHIFNASKAQLLQLTGEEANERRKHKDNPQAWVDVFTTYSFKIESLSKKNEMKVLEDLGLSSKLFYKAAQKYMLEKPQEVMFINEQLLSKARFEKAKGQESKIDLAKYKTILTEQNEFLKNNTHNLLNLKQFLKFPEPSLFSNLVRLRIVDHLWEKFGIEEEDLALFLEQHQYSYMNDPTIQNLLNTADSLLMSIGA